MNRSEMREQTFKFLYQAEIHKDINDEMILLFLENNNITDKEAIKYLTDIVNGVKEEKSKILNLIEKNLKEDWEIERISKINLALLELAIYEIIYTKTPYKVAINEVIELAKKYGIYGQT